MAWTVVGLEVTVIVRDLGAARTTLPEFLDSIRRDYGPVSPRGEDAKLLPGQVAEAGVDGNATAAADGLRHRAPSQGAVVEVGGVATSTAMS